MVTLQHKEQKVSMDLRLMSTTLPKVNSGFNSLDRIGETSSGTDGHLARLTYN